MGKTLRFNEWIALVMLIWSSSCGATIIISNANSGLGEAIIQKLSTQNQPIILIGRDIKKLNANKAKYAQQDTPISAYSFDYAQPKAIQNAFQHIQHDSNFISGLVVITPRPKLDDSLLPSPDSWSEMFNACFVGPLEMIKQSLPLMSHGGSIVIVSGITSKEVLPKHAAFGILRSMWLAEAKGLSHQLGSKGIRVNTVSPGGVLTKGFVEKLNRRAKTNQLSYIEQLNNETENIPLKKYAKPEDIANAVAFLLSDDAGHISGSNLTIDGGFTKAY